METKPTHEQAQLHLQVYDLRREARLRQPGTGSNKITLRKHSTTRCASRRWEVKT